MQSFVSGRGPDPVARLLKASELPRFRSTRDDRDRLDLVTEEVPVAARRLRADRIRYHRGDTAAPHYHDGCHHLFYVLEGEGVLHVDGAAHRLRSGAAAAVGPSEVHWFENPGPGDFSFVEFWAPPPAQTVWVSDDT
jgi:mannose-6-phosphate isomerase-like protein (cupin superfamily)